MRASRGIAWVIRLATVSFARTLVGQENAMNEFRSPGPLLEAKSIAIVGASERGEWPSAIYNNLRELGFEGG